MNIRYQVLWDNRPSAFAKRSKEAASAAPKQVPYLPDIPSEQVHRSDNGLYGHVDFSAAGRGSARVTAQTLKKQGYLGVSIWDTQNNPLSKMFRL